MNVWCNINGAFLTSFLALLLGGFATGVGAAEKIILDEQWTDYADGGEPQAPWIIGGTTDALPEGEADKDSVKIIKNWAVIDNSGTEENNWNPSISAKIDLSGGKLSLVCFTYRLDRDYTDASQIIFALNQGKKTLASIVLGKNYQYKGIISRLPNNKYNEVGHRFKPGEEVTLILYNFDFTKKTYSLSWKSSKGTSGSKDSLPFFDPQVSAVDSIRFGESSIPKSQSKLLVKDIRVVVEEDAGK